jgi:hypothetical protein
MRPFQKIRDTKQGFLRGGAVSHQYKTREDMMKAIALAEATTLAVGTVGRTMICAGRDEGCLRCDHLESHGENDNCITNATPGIHCFCIPTNCRIGRKVKKEEKMNTFTCENDKELYFATGGLKTFFAKGKTVTAISDLHGKLKDESRAKKKYPYLGISEIGNVVLFTKPDRGTCVHSANGGHKLGAIETGWIENMFEPLRGTVVLRNV